MGIATSQGIMYDFAGPYTIGVERLAFGAPTRYLQLDPREILGEPWDESVRKGCDVYSRRMVSDIVFVQSRTSLNLHLLPPSPPLCVSLGFDSTLFAGIIAIIMLATASPP